MGSGWNCRCPRCALSGGEEDESNNDTITILPLAFLATSDNRSSASEDEEVTPPPDPPPSPDPPPEVVEELPHCKTPSNPPTHTTPDEVPCGGFARPQDSRQQQQNSNSNSNSSSNSNPSRSKIPKRSPLTATTTTKTLFQMRRSKLPTRLYLLGRWMLQVVRRETNKTRTSPLRFSILIL